MTEFPALQIPYGLKRSMRAHVRQRLRADLKLEREFVGGHVQHLYEITWGYLSAGNRRTFEDWFAACRGRITSDIAFTDPWDGETYTCRLDIDEIEFTAPGPVHFTSAIRLIEVADWKAIKPAVTAFPTAVPFLMPNRGGVRYRTVIEAAPDGTEKSFEDFASPIRRWGVDGDVLTDEEITALLDCWEGNCGPWREFSFTDADGTTHPHCHFVETEITHRIVTRNAGSHIHSCRMTVEKLE